MILITLNDGNNMPRELFGCYQLRQGMETYTAVTAALAVGYRGFDTATLYRNEVDVGRAIRDFLQTRNLPRSHVFLQGKVQDKDQGYEQCLAAFAATVEFMQVDYLDSYLIHSPRRGCNFARETWRAMTYLQQSGKVRSIGVSNFDQVSLSWLPVKPALNQLDCSPFNTRKSIADHCRKMGICFQAYAPLTRAKKLAHPILQAIANKHQVSPAQVLLKWAELNCDSFVVKSRSAAHMTENYNSALRPLLSTEDITKLSTLHDSKFFVMGWNLVNG